MFNVKSDTVASLLQSSGRIEFKIRRKFSDKSNLGYDQKIKDIEKKVKEMGYIITNVKHNPKENSLKK